MIVITIKIITIIKIEDNVDGKFYDNNKTQ